MSSVTVTNQKTTFDGNNNPDYAVAVETIAGDQYQLVKLIDPTAASTAGIGIASNPMIVTTTTPSAYTDGGPTVFTVGVASASLFVTLGVIKELYFKNTSVNTISLGFNATAVLGSGVTLARGEVFIKDTPFTGQINAIASGAGSTLAYNGWS